MATKSKPQVPALKPKHKTTPLADSITPVPGFPKKLAIYKLDASPYWWVRYFTAGKIIRRTTKENNKRMAFAFAKIFFEDLLVKQRQGLALTQTTSFEACAQAMLHAQAAQLARGDITKITHDNTNYRLNKIVLPYFGTHEVGTINYDALDGFLHSLSSRKDDKLSPSTISAYMKLVRKVLADAERRGRLNKMPQFPKVRTEDNPRGYFTTKEYRLLWQRARAMCGKIYEVRKVEGKGGKPDKTLYSEKGKSTEGRLIRRVAMTEDLYELIVFMVNSYIRPTDIRHLQHKHVELMRDINVLKLRLPPSKKHKDPIITMPQAAHVYERLKASQIKQGLNAKPDDYVFMPKHSHRGHALKMLQRQFDVLLENTGLRQGVTGAERSLYSLRHTCIMYRLLYGEKMDHITLARNARTSAEMVDRFYASQLKGEDSVDMLISRRRRGPRLVSGKKVEQTAKIRLVASKA